MDSQQEQALITAAKEALKNAYTIMSNFPVGAAVLTTKGNIYKGCNTESVISGMGVCAERSAIDHAVANGEYCFTAIAINAPTDKPTPPCGMCRQYIGEFSQVSEENIKIIMVGKDDKTHHSNIEEMASPIFGPKDLGIDLSKYRER